MKLNNSHKLFLSILLPFFVGAVGSFFTTPSVTTWYVTLVKPFFQPPSWLFGPVWTILYVLMGISFWFIWKSRSSEKNRAIKWFFIQLLLNGIWSPIFFGAHEIDSALAIIVLMWMSILLTILLFKKISKPAAWLLVPYLAWVGFATVLNFAIWRLN